MTKIKLCGLTRICDIQTANEFRPEYVGFVFAPASRRYITPEKAAEFKDMLSSDISAVGVFTDEKVTTVADMLNGGIIDIAQLHGNEDENYIAELRKLTDKKIIKAFHIDTPKDVENAEKSTADYILFDSGAGGTGTAFDWELIKSVKRPYFLAGGLSPENVKNAVDELNPYAVDVSSGIETDGQKDRNKIAEFIAAVRKENEE